MVVATEEERVSIHTSIATMQAGQESVLRSLNRLREDVVNWQVLHRSDHQDLKRDIEEVKRRPTMSGKDLSKIAGIVMGGAVTIATAIFAMP